MKQSKVTDKDREVIRTRRTPTLVRIVHQLNVPSLPWPRQFEHVPIQVPSRDDLEDTRHWQLMEACWLEIGYRAWRDEVKRLRKEGKLGP